jgi:hypothetical protein
VLVELKAIMQLENIHLAQVLIISKLIGLRLLVNQFGSKSLTFKKVVL